MMAAWPPSGRQVVRSWVSFLNARRPATQDAAARRRFESARRYGARVLASPSRLPPWPAGATLVLAFLWTPALTWGFSRDDFQLVPITFASFLHNPVQLQGRPVSLLTIVLLPANAFAQHALNYSLYIACILVLARICRHRGLGSWPSFLAMTSVFHPAFLWSVTWISQRSDLIMLLFLLLALSTERTWIRTSCVVLSAASRTPFVFQSAVFGFDYLKRRKVLAAVVCAGALVGFLLAGYFTYYASSKSGDNLSSFDVSLLISGIARGAKLLEGAVYVLAPIPMFASNQWLPFVALAVYGACWSVIMCCRWTALGREAGFLGLIALSVVIPFAFSSEVRVAGPAAVMMFMVIANANNREFRNLQKVAVILLLTMNLGGIALNYGTFRSTTYGLCPPSQEAFGTPAYDYEKWRDHVRHDILSMLGVRSRKQRYATTDDVHPRQVGSRRLSTGCAKGATR